MKESRRIEAIDALTDALREAVGNADWQGVVNAIVGRIHDDQREAYERGFRDGVRVTAAVRDAAS